VSSSQAASPEPAAVESNVIRSPLAGVVSKVETEAGADVSADQEILILEAMKMFTTITSPRSGRIKAVRVAAADAVKQGQILVEFE
jgi:methylmalonyl-CoA carboxyltransferase small subunit